MWAAPHWSPVQRGSVAGRQESAIAYGRAQDAYNSQLGLYDLYVMDRDGSNKLRLFPSGDEMGLEAPQMAWSPSGDQVVIAHHGNLHRLDLADGQLRQLTADGESGHPRWSR
jgi:Tol biopolymer transport system component